MLQDALRYLELGYPVFPCVPGGKTPLTPQGFHDASDDPEQVRRWWEQFPQANIAIPTAGLLVVDIDGDDNRWLDDEPDKLLDLTAGPMCVTPRGGTHRWFRQAEDRAWRNTQSELAPRVDTRAHGGYVLVPPSRTADGRYVWVVDSELEPPTSLAEPPTWLTRHLDTIEALRDLPRPARNGDHGATITEGRRNSTLASIAGTMRRVAFGRVAIEKALLQHNLERCDPPLPETEVRRIAQSISRYAPDEVATAHAENHYDEDRAERGGDECADPGAFPAHLLHGLPGILGQFVAWVDATSFRSQPVLALGAGLALMGAVVGPQVADDTDTRANLYILGVCPSGGGKERARQAAKRLLYLAGADRLIGPEGIASHAGLISAIQAQSPLLLQVDEIGKFFKVNAEARQSPHLAHVTTNLMKLYTSANSVYKSDAYADASRNATIDQPHLCLYGTTTAKPLYESLTADSVLDGFLGRLLILETAEMPEKRARVAAIDPPEPLVGEVRAWVHRTLHGNLATLHPKPDLWSYTGEAEAIMAEFDAQADTLLIEGGQFAPLWARAAEKARKLALVHACSKGVGYGRIDADSVRWACTVSEHLSKRLAYLASRWVAENRYQRNLNAVWRAIEESPVGLTQSQLCRSTRFLTIRERADILDALQSAGMIAKKTETTATKRRTIYVSRLISKSTDE